MDAIRIIENITSDSITIKNLSRFKGKKVEIILFLCEEDDEQKSNDTLINALFGTLKSDIDGLEYQKKIRADWIK